ncbi:TM0106 family RecB-like putative nuclease [Leucobacter sp. 1207-22]|uniref:TM0106 family RecB-like putative nuclease n=1 Tax=Leucobacter sp. 1207-22 TaxID=2604456 RepID=UPI0040635AA9
MFMQHRSGGGTRIMTSASDLTAASMCEFAFLRRVDAKLGRNVAVPADDDPMLARAAALGNAHEERVLEQYRAEFAPGEAGHAGGVVEIARCDPRDEIALTLAAQATRESLLGQTEVVFQATFFDPAQKSVATESGEMELGFLGFADFLKLQPNGDYEVQDTKLARRAKVTALMQLAAYAEQLERIGVPVSPEAVLIMGDGAESRHKVADIAPVFRARRERLHRMLFDRVCAVGNDGTPASAEPVRWGDASISACGTCEVCEPEVTASRDPLLIAGITRRQRDLLRVSGYETIDSVAALEHQLPEIDGIAHGVLERTVAQAAVQLETSLSGTLAVRVVDAQALAAIPAPSEGDLFFDFEGDPLYREPQGHRWGIDYLFGMVDVNERFTSFWAHDLEAEKQALRDFLDFVNERRSRWPDMKIYHYAAYEKSHLLSIAARHGVGEVEVDQLLREHVLVDLYPIVRRALRVGSRSYSIKKLEPLYMGNELRDQEGVTSGAQSVSEYAEASAQLASSDLNNQELGQRRLDAIADYNRYDCVSTLRLRDWLLSLARAHDVVPFSPTELLPAETLPNVELSEVGSELLELADAEFDPARAQALRLASSAIDYHQREQKSFWWSHYARLTDPIDDWADTRDVVVVESSLSYVEEDWHTPEGKRASRRYLRIRGGIAPGSSLKPGTNLFALYEYPAPFPTANWRPGERAARNVTVIERHLDGVTIEEMLGRDTEPYVGLPVALTPGAPPHPGRQKGAIEEWGRTLVDAVRAQGVVRDPVFGLLCRAAPHLREDCALVAVESEAALATVDGNAEHRTIGAVTASIRLLDRAALAVQGPPGTGKTYLAARVIKRLVEEDGWRIGVVAQSHKVVENVLSGVVRAGVSPEVVGKVPQTGTGPTNDSDSDYTLLPKNGHGRFLAGLIETNRGGVIGGTAWDFSNEDRIARRSLDLLVIDEAGQFSLAPTIAASVAAERLLLLGDPQQLPQVSQGSHPEPVDTSALGWLLGEQGTLPADKGYFLAETRRMRPELTEVVSELSYENRLTAHESALERSAFGVGNAGLSLVTVSHSGNATHSPEEAAVVEQLVRRLLAGELISAEHPRRAVDPGDIIVVAAYNAQVECITEWLLQAGLDGIRVGTVDKFQGQEAAFAVVSMAASSADDVPRGLEFLLMRNRLNVAMSRAQWAAYLVASDRLGDGLPTSAESLAALSGYLRLLERASHLQLEV